MEECKYKVKKKKMGKFIGDSLCLADSDYSDDSIDSDDSNSK